MKIDILIKLFNSYTFYINKKFNSIAFFGSVFILFPFLVKSQVILYNSSVPITITTGVQLTIKGDYLNLGTGTINNSDTIDLSGDFINNASNNCFGTSQGTVILNGAVNQTIGGTSVTSFNNLALINPNQKILSNDILVGGTYALPAGVLSIGDAGLFLNSNTVTITNPISGALISTTGEIISEEVDNSSKVIWKIGTDANPHTVPFGDLAGTNFPFTYHLTSGNAGDVTFSTYKSSPANTPFPSLPIAVTHIRNNAGVDNSANMVDRYWNIETTGTPVSEFTFSWPVSENATNGTINPRGQNWNDPQIAWTIPFAGQTNPTAQSVVVPGITDFNHGTWAIALETSPLPVELLSFTAMPEENNRIRCDWVTASEINNDFFTVERSKDGVTFEALGIVDGSGTTSAVSEYYFYDMKPYSGISYYRLMQTDFDGTQSLSRVVVVRWESETDIDIYPTIVNDVINIQSNSDLYFSLYSAEGRLVLGQELRTEKRGSMGYQIHRGNVVAGIYFARATTRDGQAITQKLIFQ